MFKRKNRQHKNSEPKANNVITTAVETKESAPADAVLQQLTLLQPTL